MTHDWYNTVGNWTDHWVVQGEPQNTTSRMTYRELATDVRELHNVGENNRHVIKLLDWRFVAVPQILDDFWRQN